MLLSVAGVHDRRYKRLFSHPLFFQKLMESFVHEEFVAELDFSTLERLDKQFVSEEYAERESDIVWKLSYRGSPIYIFVLLEFQSSVDRTMSLRFLRYICEFYQSYYGKTKSGKLPAVFPLLLYNGDEKWTAESRIEDIIERSIPEGFIPRFGYYRVIENELAKQTLLKIRNAVSAVFYVENSSPEELERELEELFSLIETESPEVVKLFSGWINNFLAAEDERRRIQVEGKIENVLEVKAMFATKLKEYERKLIQRGRNEGRTEGKAEGRAEGKVETARRMLADGLSAEKISGYTGLSIEEIEAIRKEM